MSVKFVSDYNSGATKEFASIYDLLNPVENKLWTSTLTVKNLKTVLQSLYTAENLKNHTHILLGFNPNTDDNSKLLLDAILASTTEDKYWLFCFLPMSARTDGKVNYTRFKGLSRNPDYERNIVFRYEDDYSSFRSNVTSDTFVGNVTAHINVLDEAWGPLFEEYRNGGYNVSYNLPLGFGFLQVLSQMLSDSKYVIDSAGRTRLTTSQVYEALVDNNDGASFEVVMSGDILDHCKLTVRLTDTNRKPIHKLLNYSADVYEILGGPLLDVNEKRENTALYGVELELSTDYSVRELVEAGKNAFMLCKQDGSVNGNKTYHYEAVTRPMSLKMQKRQWAYFFHKLDYDKFDTTKTTNNGMHVHIDRVAFVDKLHLHKFTWFFSTPAHRSFMFAMSERNENSFDQYSPMPTFTGTKGKSFVNVLNAVAGLRGAINLKKSATVEVRLFRGVVSFASVLKNLEFVDSILKFTEDRSMSQMSLRDYNSWLYSTPKNQYVVLKKYFEEMNIAQYFIYSDMKNITFIEKNAEKIVQMIKKSGITVTEDHVKVLNEEHPKMFEFVKGQIEVHSKFRNSLASMDRVLEFNLLRNWS